MTLKFPGMTALKILTVFIIGMVLGITACTPPEPTYPPLVDDRDRDRDRDRDDEDRNNRERDNPRRTGECGKDRKCQDICDDIFRSRRDREECEELSIADAKRMEHIFKVLEDPDTDDLAELDTEDLEFLFDISSGPLEKAVDKMSQSEKKKFLIWMAETPDIAQVIEDAEDDFAILKELFGTTMSRIIEELNKNLKSGDTFVEFVLEEGNDVVLEWLDDFFGDQCDNDNNYERCVFEDYYCNLKLSDDAEDEYLDYDFFEGLLDEILSEERKTSGVPAWWRTDTEAKDLETWRANNACSNNYQNVCKCMKDR